MAAGSNLRAQKRVARDLPRSICFFFAMFAASLPVIVANIHCFNICFMILFKEGLNGGFYATVALENRQRTGNLSCIRTNPTTNGEDEVNAPPDTS
jgi:hypothetical protein